MNLLGGLSTGRCRLQDVNGVSETRGAMNAILQAAVCLPALGMFSEPVWQFPLETGTGGPSRVTADREEKKL